MIFKRPIFNRFDLKPNSWTDHGIAQKHTTRRISYKNFTSNRTGCRSSGIIARSFSTCHSKYCQE